MPREKLLSGGLKQAGIKNKAKRKRIKARIIAGKKRVGLGAAGVPRRSQTELTRKDIKENVTIAAATRAKRRASRVASRTERRVRRVLPQGIRGSRRTGGGR